MKTDFIFTIFIILSGWVYPSDIEELLLESPKIGNVCVVGVQFDEIAEVPAAIVVRRNGAHITEAEIFKMVEGKTDHSHFLTKKFDRTDFI